MENQMSSGTKELVVLTEEMLDKIVYRIVRGVCDDLDEIFPGKNISGITDADAFGLDEFLKKRLMRFVDDKYVEKDKAK